ncbi:MAG: helix-turn-helix transcriptional regulator [Lachnospiraceae bacterium]|nr:helix-turn-helix transcriptional regulator [Lachnospiraceae bacterium]
MFERSMTHDDVEIEKIHGQLLGTYPTSGQVENLDKKSMSRIVNEIRGKGPDEGREFDERERDTLYRIDYSPLIDILSTKSMTVYDLVDKCKLSGNMVGIIEMGLPMSISTLNYIADVLECSPEELYTCNKEKRYEALIADNNDLYMRLNQFEYCFSDDFRELLLYLNSNTGYPKDMEIEDIHKLWRLGHEVVDYLVAHFEIEAGKPL